MRRPYINCPFDPFNAALAMKNFGFEFSNLPQGSPNYFTWDFHDGGMVASELLDRYYIADESLPLLDPQDWDLGIDKDGALCIFGSNEWHSVNPHAYQDRYMVIAPVAIIFRKLKPFPKIERQGWNVRKPQVWNGDLVLMEIQQTVYDEISGRCGQ